MVVSVTKILFLCFSEFQKYEIFVKKFKNTIKLNIKIKLQIILPLVRTLKSFESNNLNIA